MRVLSNHVSSAARYQPISSNYDLFDRFGRTVIRHWRPSYVAPYYDHFVYTYDRASNRVTAENERTSGRDWLYTYDGLHRLSDARMGTLSGGDIATPDFRHNWSLDMLGNWSQFNEDRDGGGWELQQTRTHNDVNELTAFTAGAWKTPQHDPRGNMVTMPRPGDEDASTGKSIGAVYDIWNRQVRTFDDSDSDGVQDAGEEIIAEYRYDGLNRRIRKFLPRYTGGPGEPRILADWTVRDDYYNQSWQLLETRKADDVARSSLGGGKYAEPAAATSVYCQYIWSPEYIDALVCRDRDADGDAQTGDLGTSGSGLEERLVYLYDANYNVTALLREFVGYWVVCERYSYDPYGKVTVLHGGQGYDPEVDGVNIFEWMPKSANPDGSPCVSRYDNEVLYCGYRFDWETGFYNVRYRIYHPTLGRWTRRDPAGNNRQRISLYEYCYSYPSVVDPLGLQAMDRKLAERVLKEYIGLWGTRKIPAGKDNRADACPDFILYLLNDGWVEDYMWNIGVGVITAPAKVVLSGWNKVAVIAAEEAINLFRKGEISEDGLLDMLQEVVKDATGVDVDLKLATEILKEVTKGHGEDAEHVFLLPRSHEGKSETVSCLFGVSGTAKSHFLRSDSAPKWKITGTCYYTCKPGTKFTRYQFETPCGTKATVKVDAEGTDGNSLFGKFKVTHEKKYNAIH